LNKEVNADGFFIRAKVALDVETMDNGIRALCTQTDIGLKFSKESRLIGRYYYMIEHIIKYGWTVKSTSES
jgi:hypothetical protein